MQLVLYLLSNPLCLFPPRTTSPSQRCLEMFYENFMKVYSSQPNSHNLNKNFKYFIKRQFWLKYTAWNDCHWHTIFVFAAFLSHVDVDGTSTGGGVYPVSQVCFFRVWYLKFNLMIFFFKSSIKYLMIMKVDKNETVWLILEIQ